VTLLNGRRLKNRANLDIIVYKCARALGLESEDDMAPKPEINMRHSKRLSSRLTTSKMAPRQSLWIKLWNSALWLRQRRVSAVGGFRLIAHCEGTARQVVLFMLGTERFWRSRHVGI
jgi:hypothetical protein